LIVDETYRNQLRELNELNWERFRAELRAEGAAIRAEMDKRFVASGAEMDKRFTAVDKRFTEMEKRFSAIDARLDSLEGRFPTFEARLDAKFDAKFAKFETRMYKVMFGFWTATVIPLAALILALDGAFQR
jgi:predicted  nucleic acid-binding Zn-ribbon protein